MCPLCLTTTIAIVTGTTSSGGLTALILQKLAARIDAKSIDARAQTAKAQKQEIQKQEDKNAVYENETNIRSAA